MQAMKHIKRVTFFFCAVATIIFVNSPNLHADSTVTVSNLGPTEYYLKSIADSTINTLAKVDRLPDALDLIEKAMTSWLLNQSDYNGKLQSDFGKLSETSKNDTTNTSTVDNDSLETQRKLIAAQIGDPVKPESFTGGRPSIQDVLPNIKDLSYISLIKKDSNDGRVNVSDDYIKNVGGFNISRPAPSKGMGGDDEQIKKYQQYYDTIMSIQTYNAAVLTKTLKTNDQQNTQAQAQTKAETEIKELISSSDWFKEIFAAPLGVVLRQILMFQSQMYVQLTQLTDTFKQLAELQKDLVIAQTMTNTLLMINNQNNEKMMVMDATGSTGAPE